MPEGHQFSLQEADQRRGDFADQRPKLTKAQRFKLRVFLAFAKLLRRCCLV
jgi:hypothetical protein